jgi:hypothetical protein
MKTSKERKFAGIMSLFAAVGNFGAIAIIINAANLTEFISILPNSPRILIILLSGLLSLAIGVVLLLPIETGRNLKLGALIISILIFTVAAVQTSIALLFVLLWPWSLYRLYRSESA